MARLHHPHVEEMNSNNGVFPGAKSLRGLSDDQRGQLATAARIIRQQLEGNGAEEQVVPVGDSAASVVNELHNDAPMTSTLDWVEKQTIMDGQFGFLAPTSGELNRAFSVVPFIDSVAGAARHLNEVLLHQRKNSKVTDPAGAIRSIVRDMGRYYLDAQERSAVTGAFASTENVINPTLSPSELDENTSLFLAQTIRQQLELERSLREEDRAALAPEAQLLVGGGDVVLGSTLGQVALFHEVDGVFCTGDEHARKAELLCEFASRDMTAGSMKEVAARAHTMHLAREEFWRKRLEESGSHTAVSGQVKQILQESM